MSVIEFKPISKSDKPIFDKLYNLRRHEDSHMNFTNLFMWAEHYDARIAVEDDVLYTLVRHGDSLASFQPLGVDEKMPEAIEKICQHFSNLGAPVIFSSLEKFFVEILEKIPNRSFKITSNEKISDYVYLAEDLIELAGRKYHSKKNNLRGFWKACPTAKYLEITPEILGQCGEELERWYANRSEYNEDPEYLAHERDAIYKIFDAYQDLNLKGAAIRFGGKIVAFTVGEQINSDTAVIHIEKADPDIRGAYAAINHAFVENEWNHMTYINREEDLGLEGLKRAKESYHPTKLIEKFSATLV